MWKRSTGKKARNKIKNNEKMKKKYNIKREYLKTKGRTKRIEKEKKKLV